MTERRPTPRGALPPGVVLMGFALIVAGVVLTSVPGEAQTYRKKWTTTADFNEGPQINVNATTVPDQLQLNLGGIETPYLWVSNSGSNTVSRISTASGRVLSVTPITGSGPSRTAVDLDFNCWVSLRYDTNGRAFKLSAANGSVLGITPYIGANTRGVAINSSGEVWISSSQLGVEGGFGWTKLLPETPFRPQSILAHFQNTEPSYGLAIDPFNRVFSTTSWLGGRAVQRVNGDTGVIEQTWFARDLDEANIYGLAADIDGDLWGTYWRDLFASGANAADNDANVVWIDGDHQCPNGAASCNIAPGAGILRNINVRSVIQAVGGSAGPYGGRGIAVDANGFVWAVFNDVGRMSSNNLPDDWRDAPSYAVKLDRATGDPILAVPTGIGTVGITPDARGFIWVVNYRGGGVNYQDVACPAGSNFPNPSSGGTVTQLRSSDGSVVASYPTCGLEPYTYSDMAGYSLRSVTLRSGSWRVRHDSGRDGLEWETISWLDQVPVDGQLRLRVRAADSTPAIDASPFVDVTNGADINQTGRLIDVEAFFFTRNDFLGPVLEELTVSSVCLSVAETCDGFDNNCDGLIDNNTVDGGQACNTNLPGACLLGERRCINGNFQCLPVTTPDDEVCDGVDNNCDGRVDEGVSNLCGGCGAPPQDVCDGDDNDCDGSVDEFVTNLCGSCGPTPTEVCDGDDDDCDGLTDEGVSNLCGGCGAPPTEICDDGDNDCDGLVDEGVLNTCGECAPQPAESCNGLDDDCDGVVDNGVLNACGECGPAPEEVCNGLDDDCDGQIDEDVINACGGCGPDPVEVCDGLDNNCDGLTDEGVSNRCGGCGPEPEESCNGLDDNCDGVVDEGVTNLCGTCGVVPNEACDGQDNDCDGAVDEGETNACGTCGALGPDLCDAVDNDCDGQLDEDPGCAEGRTCISGECAPRCAAGECPVGFYCNADGYCLLDRCLGRTCPPQERCVDGECFDDNEIACRGVQCQGDEVCIGGQCVADPCTDITCDAGQSCWLGACEDSSVTACRGVQCANGERCEQGQCVPDPCTGVICDAGQRCIDGACEDACLDVQCSTGFVCRLGTCVSNSCFGVQCPAGQVCNEGNCIYERCLDVTCPEGQQCGLNGCEPIGSCGGVFCEPDETCVNSVCVGPSDNDDVGNEGPDLPSAHAAGGGDACGCDLAASPTRHTPWLLLALGAVLVAVRRRLT